MSGIVEDKTGHLTLIRHKTKTKSEVSSDDEARPPNILNDNKGPNEQGKRPGYQRFTTDPNERPMR